MLQRLSYPLFAFIVGLICTYNYALIAMPHVSGGMLDIHHAIVNGSADSPYRYRLLSAWMAEFVTPYTGGSHAFAYLLLHAVVFTLMASMLYMWLRLWLEPFRAAAGVALVGLYLPLMLPLWHISLYTPLEVLFLAAALYLMWKSPKGWEIGAVLLTVLASFNRETAILIPLAYMGLYVECWRERGYWLRAGLLLGIWAAVFVGLRLVLGGAPDSVSIADAWNMNTRQLGFLAQALTRGFLFLPLGLWTLAGARRAPAALKGLLFVGAVYLMTALVFGVWNESRLFLPLFVLWLPLTLKPNA